MTSKQVTLVGWVSAFAVILTQIITAVWLVATMHSTVEQNTRDIIDLKAIQKDQQTEIINLEVFNGVRKK